MAEFRKARRGACDRRPGTRGWARRRLGSVSRRNGAVLAAVNVCGHGSYLGARRSRARCLPALREMRAPDLALAGLARCQRRFAAPFRSATPRATFATAPNGFVLWADPDSMKSRAELQQEVGCSATRRRRSNIGSPRRRDRCLAIPRCRSSSVSCRIARAGFDATVETLKDEAAVAALRGESIRWRWSGAFTIRDPRGLAPSERANARSSICARKFAARRSAALRFPGVVDHLAACQRERLRKADLLNAHLASLIPLAEGLRMVLRDHLLSLPEPSIAAIWVLDVGQVDPRAVFLASHGAARGNGRPAVFRRACCDFISGLSPNSARARAGRAGSSRPSRGGLRTTRPAKTRKRMEEDPAGAIFRPGGGLRSTSTPPCRALRRMRSRSRRPTPYSRRRMISSAVHRPCSCRGPAQGTRAAREASGGIPPRPRPSGLTTATKTARAANAELVFRPDEGLVDASRLDRVIVNPGFASVYKQEEETEFRDTAVSILIDNSGSMRGKPIELACVASDLISAALERCARDRAKSWASPRGAGRAANPRETGRPPAGRQTRAGSTTLCTSSTSRPISRFAARASPYAGC